GVHAYPAACAIAESMDLDAKHVLLVAPTRLGVGVHHSRHFETSEAVEERVQRLREGEAPVVLAVDAPLGTKGAAWAREIAAACSASALWMLADAGRKTEDLADQVARLGRVDGLVVHGADATRDPASVLALGVPVALLAGKRATRAVWSAFLTARILDDEADE
ncbi:MAG: hypothetical protein M3P96_10975, partial [Actinomycetota bacterium]|nr:hypothetical protein [Actinomycetota bacterium]